MAQKIFEQLSKTRNGPTASIMGNGNNGSNNGFNNTMRHQGKSQFEQQTKNSEIHINGNSLIHHPTSAIPSKRGQNKSGNNT